MATLLQGASNCLGRSGTTIPPVRSHTILEASEGSKNPSHQVLSGYFAGWPWPSGSSSSTGRTIRSNNSPIHTETTWPKQRENKACQSQPTATTFVWSSNLKPFNVFWSFLPFLIFCKAANVAEERLMLEDGVFAEKSYMVASERKHGRETVGFSYTLIMQHGKNVQHKNKWSTVDLSLDSLQWTWTMDDNGGEKNTPFLTWESCTKPVLKVARTDVKQRTSVESWGSAGEYFLVSTKVVSIARHS